MEHLHTGLDHLFPTFVGVWILWNFFRIAAAWLANQTGLLGNIGVAIGGTL